MLGCLTQSSYQGYRSGWATRSHSPSKSLNWHTQTPCTQLRGGFWASEGLSQQKGWNFRGDLWRKDVTGKMSQEHWVAPRGTLTPHTGLPLTGTDCPEPPTERMNHWEPGSEMPSSLRLNLHASPVYDRLPGPPKILSNFISYSL